VSVIVLPLIASAPALAQDSAAAPSPNHRTADQAEPSPSRPTADTRARPDPGLLGDLGGARSRLAEAGVSLTARYTSESAYNFNGGDRDLLRETGQFDVSALADLEPLVGIKGGRMQATITYRRGHDLGADANLGVLQQVQEVYGRGQTWRLTQFWYEQNFADGKVSAKLGRDNPGQDFAAFSCHFENLSFCGAPPGNIVGDYWYNWPVSQWMARLKVTLGQGGFAQVGAYEVNPSNLHNRFFNWHFHGATGVLVPIELGWSGTSSRTGRVTALRVGGWYSTADADDVLLDVRRGPRLLTGLDPLQRSSRYGVWLVAQHQLTGRAENGKSVSGLSVYLNVTQADRRTSTTDNQIAAGLFYRGLVPSAPGDVLGIGIARTNVNARAARGRLLPTDPGALDAEYASEIYYSLHPFDWLELRPNVQLVNQPGGRKHVPNVGILGMKAAITL
jgi:porin